MGSSILINMARVKLQKTFKGVYFLEIPEEIIRLTGWKAGDEIEILPAIAVKLGNCDVILRRV